MSDFCDIIRKAVPTVSDTGYIDKTLKSVNVCNDCPVSKAKLSVHLDLLNFKIIKIKRSKNRWRCRCDNKCEMMTIEGLV